MGSPMERENIEPGGSNGAKKKSRSFKGNVS